MNDQDFVNALRKEFLEEAVDLLEQCEEALLNLEDESRRSEHLAHIFRAAHTIKGSGGAVGFEGLVAFAHRFEDCLALLRVSPALLTTDITSLLLRSVDCLKQQVQALRAGGAALPEPNDLVSKLAAATAALQGQVLCGSGGPASGRGDEGFGLFGESAASSGGCKSSAAAECAGDIADPPPVTSGGSASNSIKVDSQRIDSVMDLVGELMVVKSQLFNKVASYGADSGLQAIASLLDSIVRDLQDRTLSIRMTPLKPLFLKLQRLVRDLSTKVGKVVTFTMEGEETELDRTMVELLADPLMHMVRNSVDHGVESIGARRDAGKVPSGSISIRARQAGGRVVIDIRDDGAGLNRERIVAKARERGLLAGEEKLSDREVYSLIFAPGFSTAERVTDVSGRGVGMDVVKTNIDRLKGTIEIESIPRVGTTFVVSLPLTTSITDGILVSAGGQSLIVPMDGVRDLAPCADVIPFGVEGEVLKIRERILPVLDLPRTLASTGVGSQARAGVPRMVVVIETNGRQYALLVDAVIGQMQVVLKPLGSILQQVAGVAGAAILGDGRVALVLDLATLVKASHSTPQREAA